MPKTPPSPPTPPDWPDGVPVPRIGGYNVKARWTRQEITQLRTYYPKYGPKYCARLLGRTYNGVKIKAQECKLISPGNRSWSPEEVALLREHYGRMPARQLSSMLSGRNLKTISAFAASHGIRGRAPRWSRKDIEFLKANYGRRPSAELGREMGRSGRTVREMARRLGLAIPRTEMPETIERTILKRIGREPTTHIADSLGLSPQRVRRAAHRHLPGPLPQVGKTLWSEEEDCFLRENYATLSTGTIARRLGRLPDGVIVRARRLGLDPDTSWGARRAWRPEEDDLLRQHAPTHTYTRIGAMLGRHTLAVNRRAQELGIHKNPPKENGRKWSAREIATLKRLYPLYSLRVAAERLGRPLSAVQMQAKTLGLTKQTARPAGWTARQIEQFRQIYPGMTQKVLAVKLGRSVEEIRAAARALGLRRDAKAVVPWNRKEETYLRRHYPKMSVKTIAEHLGRTPAEVERHARSLGITKVTPPQSVPRWSREELATLRRLHPDHTCREISRILGRTPGAVSTRAATLGLNKHGTREAPHGWTRSQIATLRRLHPTHTLQQIADRLALPISRVRYCCLRLGLTKAKE